MDEGVREMWREQVREHNIVITGCMLAGNHSLSPPHLCYLPCSSFHPHFLQTSNISSALPPFVSLSQGVRAHLCKWGAAFGMGACWAAFEVDMHCSCKASSYSLAQKIAESEGGRAGDNYSSRLSPMQALATCRYI